MTPAAMDQLIAEMEAQAVTIAEIARAVRVIDGQLMTMLAGKATKWYLDTPLGREFLAAGEAGVIGGSEVAELLGVSRAWVYELAKTGALHHHPAAGGFTLISVDAYMRRRDGMAGRWVERLLSAAPIIENPDVQVCSSET